MDVRRTGCCFLLAILLSAGCRNQQYVTSYIETINNTNRELEMDNDALQYEIDVLKQTNEDLKKQNEQLRGGRRSSGSSNSGGSTTPPRLFNSNRRPPAMSPDDGLDLTPPVIETPKIEPPKIETPVEPAKPAPAPMVTPQRIQPPVEPAVEPPATPRNPAPNPPAVVDEPAPTPRAEPSRRSTFPAPDPAPQPTPEPEDVLPPPPKSTRASPPAPAATRTPIGMTNPRLPFAPPSRAKPEEIEPPPAPPAEELLPPKPVETRTSLNPTDLQKTSTGPATRLHLNPLHTGGEDSDGQPGDEGVSLLLEPQTSTGEFVPVTGTISVALLDPQLEGNAARIARWDFDEPTVRAALKTISTRRGIHLQMKWTDKRPQNHRLRLYVRMEFEDGRKVQTDREIFITLPGEISERWTPRRGESGEVARQPRTTLAEPRAVPEASPPPMNIPPVEPAPVPAPLEAAPPAVATEPAAAPPPTAPAAAEPIPSRGSTRPKSSKMITPPPALGESP